MNDYTVNNRDDNKDKLKSGIITAVIWGAILLFLFIYKITEKLPAKQEVITTMRVNFGDNRNGNGIEEPANQEGSTTANEAEIKPEPKKSVTEPKTEPKTDLTKSIPKEKVITGNNTKISAPKVEKTTNTSTKTTKPTSVKSVATKTETTKTTGTKTGTKTNPGDGKGTAAIGSLIKGRGTKPGTQGTNGTIGNNGDPLGGDGNGDSKIGIDRNLIAFIPGTMGRGGAQPAHNCTASGTISISYTVDKAGNVISARRSGGISDNCVATTSVSWVKKYVKAEKATTSSSGTYKITF